jgi:glycerol-3-phosphate dehydrogenase
LRGCSAEAQQEALKYSLEDIIDLAKELIDVGSVAIKVAAERGIDMPISTAVHAIVSGKATVDQAIEALLSRPLRAEA